MYGICNYASCVLEIFYTKNFWLVLIEYFKERDMFITLRLLFITKYMIEI